MTTISQADRSATMEPAPGRCGQAARQIAIDALLHANEGRALRRERLFAEQPSPIGSTASTGELRQFYARGMCGVFATVLHERTGWPIIGLCDGDAQAGDAPRHWVCADPAGGYADSSGLGRSLGEIEMEFGKALEAVPCPVSDVIRRFVRPTHSYEIARGHLMEILPELEMANPERDAVMTSIP